MRRLGPILCLCLAVGCGRGIEDQIVGTWRVDPSSVASSRLGPGAEKSPDWIDATKILAKVEVRFYREPALVHATGFDATSDGAWKLSGREILVSDKKEVWPTMTYDPHGARIHVTLQREADTLRMDLVKVR